MASRDTDPKDRFAVILLLALSLLLPMKLHAQDVRATAVAPDAERRSSIHELDTYVQLSEDMSIKETRTAAWVEAKRQAVEMAKTYIKTKTEIEDFTLKYDLVWSEAEGAVTVLKQVDHGIEGNSRYHVWIKAEVEYDLKPRGRSDAAQTMDPGLPLKVKVWTSKEKYRAGDSIEIFIQGNRDFYGRVVDVTADGSIVQLLPNDFRRDNLFRAGKTYKIPDKEDAFELKVTPPFGEDNIVVYASEVPVGGVDLVPAGQGLGIYRGARGDLAAQTRGISVVSGTSEKRAGAEFYEATCSLNTGE